MGYPSSLIQRKFKDIVGRRYEAVLKEYGEFLLTDEEMIIPEVRSILMPLDLFVQDITDEAIDVLSAYDATISLAYITDARVIELIEETLDHESMKEFLAKKEEEGQKLLKQIAARLEEHGFSTQSRMFVGRKGDDVVRMASNFDMVALSRRYAHGTETDPSISPTVLRICQRVEIPAFIY
ncbi:universal stress protein [Methanoculleus thermophilus]|jgi:nucleotide-binding universal stress UspA family protein|uniref:universal stress protein n=1 Tax=Methanoculleus thermophilus TaxID=2200 RepID=UPI002B98E691|nr:universal stress protein [Methanoculleus thermophilus]